jgi:hypothetical protein
MDSQAPGQWQSAVGCACGLWVECRRRAGSKPRIQPAKFGKQEYSRLQEGRNFVHDSGRDPPRRYAPHHTHSTVEPVIFGRLALLTFIGQLYASHLHVQDRAVILVPMRVGELSGQSRAPRTTDSRGMETCRPILGAVPPKRCNQNAFKLVSMTIGDVCLSLTAHFVFACGPWSR